MADFKLPTWHRYTWSWEELGLLTICPSWGSVSRLQHTAGRNWAEQCEMSTSHTFWWQSCVVQLHLQIKTSLRLLPSSFHMYYRCYTGQRKNPHTFAHFLEWVLLIIRTFVTSLSILLVPHVEARLNNVTPYTRSVEPRYFLHLSIFHYNGVSTLKSHGST